MGNTLLEKSSTWIDGTAQITMSGLIDDGAATEEIADGIAFSEAFSNVIAFDTDEGLVLFDVSHQLFAHDVIDRLRAWTTKPFHTAVYTHGHADHVTGSHAFEADSATVNAGGLSFVAHEEVSRRFSRYRLTQGYNGHINMRQFRLPAPAWPSDWREPDLSYTDAYQLQVGGTAFDLHHARGETDDHTWAYVPEARALCVGDLFIWQFPNAGNPQKVQRYAWEWAVALRQMIDLKAELLLPAHGPPIGGVHRVSKVLDTTASALEYLHGEVLAMMNAGATLDTIVNTVRMPDDLAELPWLRPTYDEPEFVIRNLWRLYGGWYDGNPARLKPASDLAVAAETAALCGGAGVLASRAEALAGDGDLRLACHFAEMAALAEPDNPSIHAVRAAVYRQRQESEASFMAQGIFRSASLDSGAMAAS